MANSVQTFRFIPGQPSAFLPIILSLIALAAMLLGPLLFGDLHAADEGPTVHI